MDAEAPQQTFALFSELNSFDIIMLSILGLSMLIAFFRGFIREVLSLGAWVGAAIITIYLFPYTSAYAKEHIKSAQMAGGAAGIATYVTALIIISIINSIILRYVKTGMEVGLLDNFLGLLFGGLRGAFIVSLAFLMLSAAINKDNPPEWYKQSVTKDYQQQGADFLVRAAPHYLKDINKWLKKDEEVVEESAPEKKKPTDMYRTQPESRKEMDRLLGSSSADPYSARQ